MKSFIAIFLGFAIAALYATSYGGEDGRQKDSASPPVAVYFQPGTLELATQEIGKLMGKLSRTKSYQIQGYASDEDKLLSEEESLAMAEHRANVVKDILVRNGFSPSRLTTAAWDRGNECKAVIVETMR